MSSSDLILSSRSSSSSQAVENPEEVGDGEDEDVREERSKIAAIMANRYTVPSYLLVGLRIRSIFGRIRIQQIRIFKTGSGSRIPDPTGTYQESIQTSVRFLLIFE